MSALRETGFRLRPLPRRVVFVLHSAALEHLTAAGSMYDLYRVRDVPVLERHLRDAPAATAVVLDPYGSTGRTLSPELRDLVRRHPMTPFVAALPFSPAARMADARAVLEWGVSGLLDLELERGGEALALRLNDAHARPLKRRVEPGLSRHLAGTTLTILRRAAEVATDGGSVLQMAHSLGIRPTTLGVWCSRAALPRPRRLLTWSRILLAGALAEDPTRTLAAVARACDYTSDRSLRRAVRTLLGPGSAATRRESLFATAASAFNHELRGLREELRQRERARRTPPAAPDAPAHG